MQQCNEKTGGESCGHTHYLVSVNCLMTHNPFLSESCDSDVSAWISRDCVTAIAALLFISMWPKEDVMNRPKLQSLRETHDWSYARCNYTPSDLLCRPRATPKWVIWLESQVTLSRFSWYFSSSRLIHLYWERLKACPVCCRLRNKGLLILDSLTKSSHITYFIFSSDTSCNPPFSCCLILRLVIFFINLYLNY